MSSPEGVTDNQKEVAEALAQAKRDAERAMSSIFGKGSPASGGSGGEAEPVDEALLAEVQEVVHVLTKTLKIFRTYPRENTISVNAIEELTRTFATFLDKHQTLELFVDRHELQWRGRTVYTETDPRRSFALKLDRDGVRRLMFSVGIDGREVVGLLEALTTEVDEASLKDDLVTILWEKQLSHVKVYVLDDLSSGKSFDEALVNSDEPSDAPQDGASAGSSWSSSQAPAVAEVEDDGTVQATLCSAAKAKLNPTTDEQISVLKEMSENEEHHDVSEDLTDILLDILQSESQQEVHDNALKVLVELVMMHARATAFGKAADTLGATRALAANESIGRETRAMAVQHLQSLAEPTCIAPLIETLRDHESVNKADLGRFLQMLPAAAAPELCTLLELDRYDDTLRDAIKHLIKDDPKLITAKLAGPDVELAKKVLGILEHVAGASLGPALVDPLMAAEAAVKQASVSLLMRLKGAPARELLLHYVGSEEAALRKTALKALSAFEEGPGPATALRAQVAAPDFYRRTFEEKKSFLTTLARLESHFAMDILEEILTRKRWFEKNSHAETRACAALALGEIDDDRARELLERHVSDKSEAVRTASRLALAQRERTMTPVGSSR